MPSAAADGSSARHPTRVVLGNPTFSWGLLATHFDLIQHPATRTRLALVATEFVNNSRFRNTVKQLAKLGALVGCTPPMIRMHRLSPVIGACFGEVELASLKGDLALVESEAVAAVGRAFGRAIERATRECEATLGAAPDALCARLIAHVCKLDLGTRALVWPVVGGASHITLEGYLKQVALNVCRWARSVLSASVVPLFSQSELASQPSKKIRVSTSQPPAHVHAPAPSESPQSPSAPPVPLAPIPPSPRVPAPIPTSSGSSQALPPQVAPLVVPASAPTHTRLSSPIAITVPTRVHVSSFGPAHAPAPPSHLHASLQFLAPAPRYPALVPTMPPGALDLRIPVSSNPHTTPLLRPPVPFNPSGSFSPLHHTVSLALPPRPSLGLDFRPRPHPTHHPQVVPPIPSHVPLRIPLPSPSQLMIPRPQQPPPK